TTSHSIFRFRPTGESIAVHVQAGNKGESVIHELAREDGKLLQKFGVPENAKKVGFVTRLLCLSPDWNKLLLNQYPDFGMSKEEQSSALLLWDVEEKKELWRVLKPFDSGKNSYPTFMSMAGLMAGFSPDGKWLFVKVGAFPGKTSGIWV